uniref:Aminotransferase-like plant mobile domain-containing protein n=1 Tax=Fagus sylvatica TaxID=28930 RepID=A0A2N9IU44_FAGSY
MASPPSATPVGPTSQPSTGERSETPASVPTASTETVVDATVVPPLVPGEATPVAPSSVSDETDDPRKGFAFPLVDPCYKSSPLFPPRSLDFPFPMEDWDWTVTESKVAVDRAWVSSFDEISELLILKRDIQPVPIDFDFPCAASKDWDTEPLREVLRRWCPSTHTFFFSWGELTPTLEDIANHWMLPVLGEHSFSSIELSVEEEEIATTLRRQSSTRLSGWPSLFMHRKEVPVRRAAFVLYWLCHLYSQLDLLHDCEVEGDSCYIPLVAFNTTVLQTFFWEHSVDLKTHDHDLVDTLDYEENVLFRPYRDDYLGFTCVSVFSRFYQPTSLIRDLGADDHRSLAYLSTVSPGFLPVLSATGVFFIHYCPQRVQKQFGLDQGVPVGPQETATYVPNLAPFIKSRAFACWKNKISRIMVPSGHRFGFNTSSMNAYWQRLTQSMVEFVSAGRGDKAPLSIHRGWIAYTIHLPQGWRSSVNVVEDRLIMPSKRGKGSKRDAPVDQVVEKAPKKPAPSHKKTPPKKTKAGKKGKSTTSVSASEKKSTTAPIEKPIESTVTPSKAKSVGASLSTKKPSKKSVASRPSKGQKKASVTSSPPDEEQPTTASTPPPSKKKKFTAPLFPLGACRTRSKSGSKATHGPGRSSGGVVIVEDSDMAIDDIVTSSLGGDDLQTATVDQDKDLGKSVADSPEADAESTEGSHFTSSDSFFDTTASFVPEEQMMSVGSIAGDDNMPGAGDSNIGSTDLMIHDLAIVPHASHLFEHGHDGDGAADPDTVPLSISVPQTVLTSRVTGFIISTSHLSGEAPLVAGSPVIDEVPMSEEVHTQGFVESESAMDLGVIPETSSNVDSAVDHGAQAEGTSASVADMPTDSEHLDNIGTGEAMRLPEENENMGITGEVTIASLPLRPPAGQLTTGHGNFVSNFKLSAGLGGPILSLLGSVLATMSRSNLGNVTKAQILTWKGVIQDLMEVGFDLGFLIEHLRQTTQCLFGKKIANEVQALQRQIALLQGTLAVLTAYQWEMTSTREMALGFESGKSLFDGLFS